MAKKSEYVWQDRKRTLLGLPWSFTIYKLTEEKLFIKTGFFNTNEEEILLYRITDLTLKRSLGERLFGLGTVHLCSVDHSTSEIDLKRIKKSVDVRDLFSELIQKQRAEKGITSREFIDSDHDVHDDF